MRLQCKQDNLVTSGSVIPRRDLLAQHMLSEAKAKAQAAMVLGDEHCCMVCGAKPPNPLSPWIPNEPATLRCSDAKGCQSRMINGKLAMLAEIP